MNFELLKARVKAQAADAARSIRNFDEMAAKDDYIHTTDLRTPDNTTKSSEPGRKERSPRSKATDVLNQATEFSSLMDNDVEQQLKEEEKVKEKKKNPNRFMDDLSDRLAKTDEGSNRLQITPPKEEIQKDHQQQQQPQWKSWIVQSPVMANVLSRLQSPTSAITSKQQAPPSKQQKMQPTVGPLSARKQVEQDENDDIEDSMDNFVMTSSVSVLGADEQLELERMRMATKSSGPMTAALTSIKQNPHFVFILFTLILGSAAYFYSRRREEIDEVT